MLGGSRLDIIAVCCSDIHAHVAELACSPSPTEKREVQKGRVSLDVKEVLFILPSEWPFWVSEVIGLSTAFSAES